ncbi:MAG: bifunctional DNA-formamidopyrimidine glycosylase/DNA-(apurinic or apyrimidinic site) lyase [Nitrospira sp.]|nr:bifunctional DNA-formamidopyrimidine glycosylase/DNA-(apurinic or apyrimidinic site) lyase [Nitrospira sp.]
MPELPEAEVVACQLRVALVGAEVTDCWVGRKDIVREGLSSLPWYAGSVLQQVDRYGKSVALRFVKQRDVRYAVAELGMTGLLLFRSAQTKHPQHVHVRMAFTGGREPEVRYWNPRRFGRFSFFDQSELDQYCARRFGCDPLTVLCDDFLRLITSHRGRLKPLLMHQQSLAGIGNIYANEILFRAGLHPNVMASRLSSTRVEQLYHVTQEVLRSAIACGGSSVKDFFAPDGTEGQFKQHHLVYGKEDQPCPNRCGRMIRRLQSERSAFFCPQCQNPRRWR